MAQDKPTLCWQCANACGGCSWSDGSFTPVTGWTAKKTEINRHEGGVMSSYLVTRCPQFNDDTKTFKHQDGMIKRTTFHLEKVVKPMKMKPLKGTARWRLTQLPDLQDRIERLTGENKEIADLVFNYNYTIDDVASSLFLERSCAKKYMYRAFKLMEAMA